MKPINEIHSLLSAPSKIVITAHQNPDADALGSSLALQKYLQSQGHTVTIISSTDFPDFLDWMPGSQDILILEKTGHATLAALNEAAILFCLDFNIHTRTKNLSPHLQTYQGVKVLIDHHMFPDTDYFDFGISQPNRSSTCEMVYNFIMEANHAEYITKEMADCLYAGTMTDTGSFKYSGTTAYTHRMVAHLIDLGLVPNAIHQAVFDNYSERRLRLLGHILSNNMEILEEHNAAIMHLSQFDMAKFEVANGDTEGLVNYPLSLKNVNFSTFISVKGAEDIRMSFRSKGAIDVNEFARKYFNGGGHVNAAGGKGLETLELTLQKLKTALLEYCN